MLAIYTLPVSLMAAGWLIDYIGFQQIMTFYMVMGIVFTLIIAQRWRGSIFRKDAAANVI